MERSMPLFEAFEYDKSDDSLGTHAHESRCPALEEGTEAFRLVHVGHEP